MDAGVLNASAGTSGVLVSGGGPQTLTVTGTAAQINAFLNTNATSVLTYTADSDAPPENAVLSIVVHDGTTETSRDIDIAVTAVNDAPALTGFGPSVTFAENTVNATPQLLDTAVVFADAQGNFDGGALTLSGLLAQDSASVRNEGTGAGQIGLSGTTVTYGNITIGTLAGGVGATLTITFNANARATTQTSTTSSSSSGPIATTTASPTCASAWMETTRTSTTSSSEAIGRRALSSASADRCFTSDWSVRLECATPAAT